jgi:hypothetical protein
MRQVYFDIKPDVIFIWGRPLCQRAGPFQIGKIIEPENENPLIFYFGPVGLNIAGEVMEGVEGALGLWRSVFAPEMIKQRRPF